MIDKDPVINRNVFAYDFDGVVSLGIRPRHYSDIIITGRCYDEWKKVQAMLLRLRIENKIYYNPMSYAERGDHTLKARRHSGNHKANKIEELKKENIIVERFFEDDPVQLKIIQKAHPELEIVHIVSKLVKK